MQVKDIENGLKHFSFMDREKLFEAFVNNFVYSRNPRWADLYKIAMAEGIRHSKENPLINAFNVCQECNTAYSSGGKLCPTCHKITAYNIQVGNIPTDFMRVREDCGNCKHYSGNDTDGVICGDFGTSKSHTMPMCNERDCKCYHCCYETLAVYEGVNGDTTKYDRITKQNTWEDRLIIK